LDVESRLSAAPLSILFGRLQIDALIHRWHLDVPTTHFRYDATKPILKSLTVEPRHEVHILDRKFERASVRSRSGDRA
jgi:hypothetical protein